MQMRLIRRPNIAAGIAIAADILLIVSSAVLNSLRGRFETTYSYIEDRGIISSHPFDVFGIVAAVALGIAAVMSAFIIVSAFEKNKDGRLNVPRMAGAAVLLPASVAAVMLAVMISGCMPPMDTEYYHYTDEEAELTITEEKYFGAGAVMKIFITDKEQGTARLVSTAEISDYAQGPDRYSIRWVSDNIIYITYADGMQHRSVQINI